MRRRRRHGPQRSMTVGLGISAAAAKVDRRRQRRLCADHAYHTTVTMVVSSHPARIPHYFPHILTHAQLVFGVNFAESRLVKNALESFYGVGPQISQRLMARLSIHKTAKLQTLGHRTVNDLSAELQNLTIENNLRRKLQDNIKRLRDMGTYRGRRHAMSLPVRGQHTRTQVRLIPNPPPISTTHTSSRSQPPESSIESSAEVRFAHPFKTVQLFLHCIGWRSGRGNKILNFNNVQVFNLLPLVYPMQPSSHVSTTISTTPVKTINGGTQSTPSIQTTLARPTRVSCSHQTRPSQPYIQEEIVGHRQNQPMDANSKEI